MNLKRSVKKDNMCFACGEENEISLGLKFKFGNKESTIVKAEFTPQEVHQGFQEIMHGGLISTLLDEAMAKVVYMNGIEAVTAEMTTRFKKPVPIGTNLIIKGILEKNHGRLIKTSSELKGDSGQLYAEARAKFMKVTN